MRHTQFLKTICLIVIVTVMLQGCTHYFEGTITKPENLATTSNTKKLPLNAAIVIKNDYTLTKRSFICNSTDVKFLEYPDLLGPYVSSLGTLFNSVQVIKSKDLKEDEDFDLFIFPEIQKKEDSTKSWCKATLKTKWLIKDRLGNKIYEYDDDASTDVDDSFGRPLKITGMIIGLITPLLPLTGYIWSIDTKSNINYFVSDTVYKGADRVVEEVAISKEVRYFAANKTIMPTGKAEAIAQQDIPLFITSDVDTLPPVKSKTNNNSYAIVLGIENYRQKLPKASFATHDARTVSDYLTKSMGYPEENVVTLTNEKAALGDMIKYFEKWLPNNVNEESTVMVYYSGHGAPDPQSGNAYLVPYDGDPSFIDQTGYPLKRLYDALGKLKAKNVIVALDSCFSGAGGKSVLARGARPLVMSMDSAQPPSRKIAVLSAASADQISSSYEEKGHGIFTYFLLKGIKGMIEEDKYTKLELGELFNYLKPQVERVSRKTYNAEQIPQLIVADEGLKKLGLR